MFKAYFSFLLCLAGCTSLAEAATPCVSTAGDLQNELAIWSTMSSGDMTIRLVQGTYALTLQNYYDATGKATLSILGGYTANCTGRFVAPTNTVIDGSNFSDIVLYPRSDVTIEGLTFTNLHNQFVVDLSSVPDGHSLTIRYDIFRDFVYDRTPSSNQVEAGIDLYTGLNATDIYFENNLVYDVNASAGSNRPVMLLYSSHDAIIAATSNTITGNNKPVQAVSESAGSGATYLENNIIYNGTATALVVPVLIGTQFGGPFASFNIVGPIDGAYSSSVGDMNVDPKFMNAGAHDYRILTTSPAANAGGAAVPLFGGYPTHDLNGPNNPRVVGSKIDIGAYESAYDDLNNFTVTTADDNDSNTSPTVGSLRWAIVKSNSNSVASKISFALPCGANDPSLLTLTTPLPDITTDITIDGYTNAGATKNTSTSSFNANLCVAIYGSGNLAYAFHTSGSGRLTADGMVFIGFTTAAILLEAGSGHVVTGNQFGDIPFAQPNKQAIRVDGDSGFASIGSLGDAGSINLITQCTDAAIFLGNVAGHDSVAYNMIGVASNGSTAIANAAGILIQDSSNNSVEGNWIDNSTAYGLEIVAISKATTGNVVQDNLIGKTPSGIYGSNIAGGILIFGSYANNNVIGSSGLGNVSDANLIAENGGPGVLVSTSSGVGNQIVANEIFGNTGLAIDLGQAGPTPNDSAQFDADTGPNNLQNYPLMTTAVHEQNAHTFLRGTLNSVGGQSFTLDFYYGTQCKQIGSAAPRGEADNYLGGIAVTTDLSGYAGFSLTLPESAVELGYISATATAADGSTSEIGECLLEVADDIFKNNFEAN